MYGSSPILFVVLDLCLLLLISQIVKNNLGYEVQNPYNLSDWNIRYHQWHSHNWRWSVSFMRSKKCHGQKNFKTKKKCWRQTFPTIDKYFLNAFVPSITQKLHNKDQMKAKSIFYQNAKYKIQKIINCWRHRPSRNLEDNDTKENCWFPRYMVIIPCKFFRIHYLKSSLLFTDKPP